MMSANNRLFPLSLFPLICLVTGCIPLQMRIHPDDLSALEKAPRIIVLTHNPPEFSVDTTVNAAVIGGALGGAIGAVVVGAAAAAIDERSSSTPNIYVDPKAFIKSRSFDDPVKNLRDEFVRTINERLGISNVELVDQPVDINDSKKLLDRFGGVIVLAFKTEQWVWEPVPFSSDFGLRYIASGRIMQLGDGRLLWQERCGFVPRDTSAKLVEFTADSGQGMAEKLKDVGSRCARILAKELLEKESDR